MKTFAALTVAMLVFADSWAAGDPIVPVYEEPRHRVLWGNSYMHILDLRIPPGLTLNQEDLERGVACETIAKYH